MSENGVVIFIENPGAKLNLQTSGRWHLSQSMLLD